MNYIVRQTCHYSVRLHRAAAMRQVAVSNGLLAPWRGEINEAVLNLGGKEGPRNDNKQAGNIPTRGNTAVKIVDGSHEAVFRPKKSLGRVLLACSMTTDRIQARMRRVVVLDGRGHS